MAEQDDLQLAGRTFASLADTESARFARELARVLASLERDLLGLIAGVRDRERGIVARAGRLLRLRRELQTAVREAGYTSLVTRASIDAVERMAVAVAASRVVNLGMTSPTKLAALASLMREDLLGLGDVLAGLLWRASVTALYSGRPTSEIVTSLAAVLDKTRAQAQTLFDTQVSVMQRQIVAQEPTESATQAYLYVGPVDVVVRAWCLERIGTVWTRDRIEAMDNGQLPNAYLTAGGYNCRHSWMAVSDPALVAMANTGQRAPGFAERVAVAESVKAERKRKAAA